MNWIVFVHHVDGFSLDRELDVKGSTAIVRRQCMRSPLLLIDSLAVVAVLLFLFLHVALPIPVLQAVLAHIFESRAVTAFLTLRRTFSISVTVDFLNDFNDRSVSREPSLPPVMQGCIMEVSTLQ